MKKSIIAVLLLALILSLCACTGKTGKKPEEVQQTPEIVATPEPAPDPTELYADVIAENMRDGVGVYLQDLDGDGIQELFIGPTSGDIYEKQIIRSMYTLRNNIPEEVFSSSDRDEFYLTNNGTVVEYAYQNAYDSSHIYYSYSGGELNRIITVGFDMRGNPEMPYYKQEGDEDRVTIDETQYFDWVQMYESTYESLPFN